MARAQYNPPAGKNPGENRWFPSGALLELVLVSLSVFDIETGDFFLAGDVFADRD